MHTKPIEKGYWIFIVLFLVAGLYFRVTDLTLIPGLTNDEGMHALDVHRFLQKKPVNLWMPSGRAANPIYLYVAAIFEAVFPQTIVVMRSTALLFSVLAIVVLGVFLNGAFGSAVAVMAAALLASHPLFLSHSRLGVDGALAPFAAAVLTCLALSGRTLLFLICLPISLLFHPFEILLAPLGLVSELQRRKGRGGFSLVKSLPFLILGVAGIWLSFGHLPPQIQSHIRDHHIEFADWTKYWRHVFAAVSGLSAIETFLGKMNERFTWALLSIGGSFFIGIGFTGLFRFGKDRDWVRFWFVALTHLVVLGLSFLVKSDYVGEGRERYFLPLLVPIFVSWAMVADRMGVRLQAAMLGFCLVGLLSFNEFYLSEFRREGGGQGKNLSQMFRTGPEEPVTTVLDWVTQAKRTSQRVRVLTEGRLTQPMIYLALNREEVEVIGIPQPPALARSRIREVLASCDYIAALEGEFIDHLLKQESFPGTVERKRIRDFAGRSLVHLYQDGRCSG